MRKQKQRFVCVLVLEYEDQYPLKPSQIEALLQAGRAMDNVISMHTFEWSKKGKTK